jgi:hypothetical protein
MDVQELIWPVATWSVAMMMVTAIVLTLLVFVFKNIDIHPARWRFESFSGHYMQVWDKRQGSRLVRSTRFIFIDNQNPTTDADADGTYEHPYGSLSLALSNSSAGDVIYVLPGIGTAYVGGITLQDNQQLLGSGVAHIVDKIKIPRLTDVFPTITGVVTLSNNNTVSGFQFQNSSTTLVTTNSVNGQNISNFKSAHNFYIGGIGTFTTFPAGISLANVSGTIIIDDDAFVNVGNGFGYGVTLIGTSGVTTVVISNSTFSCDSIDDAGQGSGINVTDGDIGNTILNITNVFVQGFQGGIIVNHGSNNAGGQNSLILKLDKVQVGGTLEPGVSIVNNSDYGLLSATVTNSTIMNCGTVGLTMGNYGLYTAPITFSATNSIFNNNAIASGGADIDTAAGLYFVSGNGPCNITFIGCQANGNGCTSDGHTNSAAGMIIQSYYESVTVQIANSQFNGNGNAGVGGTVTDAEGLMLYNDPASIGPLNVTLSNCSLSFNAVANGGTVNGTVAGLVVSNLGSTAMTVTQMNDTNFTDNNQFGIFATAATTGTTTIDYTGATFSAPPQTPTNQYVPANNVTWIS